MVALTVGRLTKTKVDQIQQLYEQGYTKKEIAEKLDVSRSSIAKYVRESPEGGGREAEAHIRQLLHELAKTLFDLLAHISVMPWLDEDFVADEADQMALKLMQRIAEVSPEYAKSLIKENPYIEYLKLGVLDLSKPDEELDENERNQRRAWVTMMKKYYPEKLAQLI
jgi:transcriptional regulator with XRE-family HTH domain